MTFVRASSTSSTVGMALESSRPPSFVRMVRSSPSSSSPNSRPSCGARATKTSRRRARRRPRALARAERRERRGRRPVRALVRRHVARWSTSRSSPGACAGAAGQLLLREAQPQVVAASSRWSGCTACRAWHVEWPRARRRVASAYPGGPWCSCCCSSLFIVVPIVGALRDHPGRAGDRRRCRRSRSSSPTRSSARCCCATGPRGVAALQRGARGGPRPGARGARRRARHLRRGAAAHARASSPTSSACCSCCRRRAPSFRGLLARRSAAASSWRWRARRRGGAAGARDAAAAARLRRRGHGRGRRRGRGRARPPPGAMIAPELEGRRPATGPGFLDVVTFGFGDVPQGVYGLARVGLVGDGRAFGLAVLFRGRELVAAESAEGDASEAADWSELSLAGISTSTEAPFERWPVSLRRRGRRLRPRPSRPSARRRRARRPRGGLEGYEQLVPRAGHRGRARPWTASASAATRWGAPDWDRIEPVRSLSAWLGPEAAVFVLRGPAARGDRPRRGGGRGGDRRRLRPGGRARRGRRPAPLDDLRRRGPPAAGRPGAVGGARGRLPAPRSRRGAVRRVARARRAAAGLVLPAVAHGRARRRRSLRVLRRV